MGNSNLRSGFQNIKIQDGGCGLKFYLQTASADLLETWCPGVFSNKKLHSLTYEYKCIWFSTIIFGSKEWQMAFSDDKTEFEVGFSKLLNQICWLWTKILFPDCRGRFTWRAGNFQRESVIWNRFFQNAMIQFLGYGLLFFRFTASADSYETWYLRVLAVDDEGRESPFPKKL